MSNMVVVSRRIPLSEATEKEKINFDKVKSNEDRIAFLAQYGWETSDTPSEEVTLTIPTEFDKIMKTYNELQKQQGLDLNRYQRKTVTRYTYLVTNYPDYDGPVYANVIVYRGNIIGGDLCSGEVGGFVRGFDGIMKP